MSLAITLTNAGVAKLVSAQANGTAAVTIAAVGVTSTAFVPDPTMVALPGEIVRLNTVSGQVVSPNVIHVMIQDATQAAYTVLGFALYLDDGTLFGIYGQAQEIVEKAAAFILLMAVDIQLAAGAASAVNFGSTNFIDPPASETIVGVMRLATEAETLAGLSNVLGIHPAALASVLALYAKLDSPVFTTALSGPYNSVFRNGGPGSTSGGLIRLQQPSELNALTGDLSVDLFGNLFRVYEGGGQARGVYVDLTTCQPGAATPVWHGGNFDPTSKLDKAGGSMTGELDLPVLGIGFAGAMAGGGVFAGVSGNLIQIYERGGAERGVQIDLTTCAGGAGSLIWHSGNFNPAAKQDALGYVPVQTNGGLNQTGGHVIKLGWDGTRPRIDVDNGGTDFPIAGTADIGALQQALLYAIGLKQDSLGFTPVRQGGGADQLGSTIYIGWDGSFLKAQVDAMDLGRFVFDADLSAALAACQLSLGYVPVQASTGTNQQPGHVMKLGWDGVRPRVDVDNGASDFPLTGDSLRTAFTKVNSNFAGTLQKSSNLSDLASSATARINLGLGSAATQPSTAFDPAGAAAAAVAGISLTGTLQKANNLGDLASPAAARTNLGLGSAATAASTAFDAAGAASTAQTAGLQKASNLSDLANVATARTNLGLGTAATLASSAFDAAGAASTLQASLGSAAFQPVSAFAQPASYAGNSLANFANASLVHGSGTPHKSWFGVGNSTKWNPTSYYSELCTRLNASSALVAAGMTTCDSNVTGYQVMDSAGTIQVTFSSSVPAKYAVGDLVLSQPSVSSLNTLEGTGVVTAISGNVMTYSLLALTITPSVTAFTSSGGLVSNSVLNFGFNGATSSAIVASTVPILRTYVRPGDVVDVRGPLINDVRTGTCNLACAKANELTIYNAIVGAIPAQADIIWTTENSLLTTDPTGLNGITPLSASASYTRILHDAVMQTIPAQPSRAVIYDTMQLLYTKLGSEQATSACMNDQLHPAPPCQIREADIDFQISTSLVVGKGFPVVAALTDPYANTGPNGAVLNGSKDWLANLRQDVGFSPMMVSHASIDNYASPEVVYADALLDTNRFDVVLYGTVTGYTTSSLNLTFPTASGVSPSAVQPGDLVWMQGAGYFQMPSTFSQTSFNGGGTVYNYQLSNLGSVVPTTAYSGQPVVVVRQRSFNVGDQPYLQDRATFPSQHTIIMPAAGTNYIRVQLSDGTASWPTNVAVGDVISAPCGLIPITVAPAVFGTYMQLNITGSFAACAGQSGRLFGKHVQESTVGVMTATSEVVSGTRQLSGSATVSTLPTCNTAARGTEQIVTDATSPSYLGTLTGGGSTVAKALCNGSSWVSGANDNHARDTKPWAWSAALQRAAA